MRLMILIFPAVVFVNILQAQDKAIDSLNNLLANAKTDTQKINLHVQKLALLIKTNPDTVIQIANEKLEQSRRLNFYSGIVALEKKLFDAHCATGNFNEAANNLKDAEKIIKPSDTLSQTDMYISYGKLYGMQSKYDSSIFYCKKGILLAEKNNYPDKLATLYSYVGTGYQQLADYVNALQYQQKALKLGEQQMNEASQALTLVNMGMTYNAIGDSAKAEQTYLKAIRLAVKNNISSVELKAYSNLSSLYINQQAWEKGYDYAIKCAQLSETRNNACDAAAAYSKAAVAASNLERNDEAIDLSERAVKLAGSCGQPLVISQAASSAGTILYNLKKYKEAIPYYEKSFELLKGSGLYSQGSGLMYKELADCYEKTGNYAKALKNYKTGTDIIDSIQGRENIRKATELSMNYEFDKKQQAEQSERKRLDTINQIKQIFLVAVVLVFLTLSVAALIAYKNKRKANVLLDNQKKALESTLAELKSTQAQLIQSEKMASLGELTAGIAHEIQNPLNFVNNFSEVNKEMLVELNDEIEKGNYNDARSIAKDLIDNEEKINHHGRRADAIVKGMLQHSRQSSGKKEPTDINALCDEYLRLSYHGLRAKDKSFNADFKTEFDETIGKISIVPQDMGRVLLNLYNNAFYAVNEKKKLLANSYQPLAEVKTRRINDKVEIIVSDNGNGIPQNIIDKIFQPFFTTKPTGQGTGLGLSLTYDIITKEHSGSIKVESKEGVGTTFIIQLSNHN